MMRLLACLVAIVLGGFLKLCGFNIFRVLSYFKDEILFVFAATSAETMMPRSMQKLEKLGVSREVVGLVMPGGFSFNMDGTAIYMTMSVLFLAHAFNVELTIWHQLAVLFVMLFTSKGAAGVTGGGFVALAATLPVVNAVPVAGLALLLGVGVVVGTVDEERDGDVTVVDEVGSGAASLDGALGVVGQSATGGPEPGDEARLQRRVAQLGEPLGLLRAAASARAGLDPGVEEVAQHLDDAVPVDEGVLVLVAV